MKGMKIKTSWASVSMADDGRVLVCLRREDAPGCLCFPSVDSLRQTIEAGLLAAGGWALAVPRDLCIVKNLSLPAEGMSEAATMVEFEITSLVPLSLEQVTYGCTSLGSSERLLNLLVWILKRDTLENHLQPYRTAGIEPKGIAPDAVAVHHWLTSSASQKAGSTICVLAGRSRIMVLTDVEGELHDARIHSLAQEDAESSLDGMALEILRLRQAHVSERQTEPAILLTGEETSVTRIQEQLQRTAQAGGLEVTVGVAASPPIVGWSGRNQEAGNIEGIRYEATVAAGLLGLFSVSKRQPLNLLPRERMRRQQRRAVMLQHFQQVGTGGLLVLLAWACLAATNWRLARKADLIESEIAPIRQIAGTVDSKYQCVKAIQRQLAGRDLFGRIIQELYEYTPEPISFCELRLSHGQTGVILDLRGQADMLSTAFEYTEAVRQAQWIRGIQIVNAQQIPQPSGDSVVDFKANCAIQDK